jgi:hypothetical protein
MLPAQWAEAEGVSFPLVAQPKFDGWRAIIADGVATSRNGRAIDHPFVAAAALQLAAAGFPPLDGELIAGDPSRPSPQQYWATAAILNNPSADGSALKFVAFDCLADPGAPCIDRLADLAALPADSFVVPAPAFTVADAAALAALEQDHYCRGFEGLIIRAPGAAYEPGRASAAGPLWKWKRFSDDEAIITGAAPETGKRGQKETVGAFLCDWRGRAVSIGAGISNADRAIFWRDRGALVGRALSFRYQGVTSSDLPRNPVFLRLRADPAGDAPAPSLAAAPTEIIAAPDGAAPAPGALDLSPFARPRVVAPDHVAGYPAAWVFKFALPVKGAGGWYAIGETAEGAYDVFGPWVSRRAARAAADALTICAPLKLSLSERLADWFNRA